METENVSTVVNAPKQVASIRNPQSAIRNPKSPEDLPLVVAEPRRAWTLFDLVELWHYRELAFFLAWRDIKVRYKQTLLGAAWAVIQPAAMVVVFTIVMGKMAGVPTGELPQPVFYFAGVLLWNFFAQAISAAGNSVVQSQALVTKVYFPRLAIPLATVAVAGVDFCVALAVLLLMMLAYAIVPGISILLVPVILVLTVLAALGVGALLAALNVTYRDFRHTIPFLVQLWMFATPSIYMELPVEREPPAANETVAPSAESAAWTAAGRILEWNPLTGLVASFRAAILGTEIPWKMLRYSAASTCLVFLAGCWYFRRVERNFADVI